MQNIAAYLEENGYKAEEPEEITADELKALAWDDFEEAVKRIVEACENFDGDEVAKLAGELCYCKVNEEALTTRFAEVKQCAEDFEYEQALQMAQKALEELRR